MSSIVCTTTSDLCKTFESFRVLTVDLEDALVDANCLVYLVNLLQHRRQAKLSVKVGTIEVDGFFVMLDCPGVVAKVVVSGGEVEVALGRRGVD